MDKKGAPISRRDFLKMSMAGLAGLAVPKIERLGLNGSSKILNLVSLNTNPNCTPILRYEGGSSFHLDAIIPGDIGSTIFTTPIHKDVGPTSTDKRIAFEYSAEYASFDIQQKARGKSERIPVFTPTLKQEIISISFTDNDKHLVAVSTQGKTPTLFDAESFFGEKQKIDRVKVFNSGVIKIYFTNTEGKQSDIYVYDEKKNNFLRVEVQKNSNTDDRTIHKSKTHHTGYGEKLKNPNSKVKIFETSDRQLVMLEQRIHDTVLTQIKEPPEPIIFDQFDRQIFQDVSISFDKKLVPFIFTNGNIIGAFKFDKIKIQSDTPGKLYTFSFETTKPGNTSGITLNMNRDILLNEMSTSLLLRTSTDIRELRELPLDLDENSVPIGHLYLKHNEKKLPWITIGLDKNTLNVTLYENQNTVKFVDSLKKPNTPDLGHTTEKL